MIRRWDNDVQNKLYKTTLKERSARVIEFQKMGKHCESRILSALHARLDSLELQWEGLKRQRDRLVHADLDLELIATQQTTFGTCFGADSLTLAKQAVMMEKNRMKKKGHSPSTSLTYGEIEFFPFAVALQKLVHRYGLRAGGVFYDLGHGTGKPPLAATLVVPERTFKKVAGVEIMDSLFRLSELNRKRWQATNSGRALSQKLPGSEQLSGQGIDIAQLPTIQFAHGSFLDFQVLDWSDASVIFTNSTWYVTLKVCDWYFVEQPSHTASVIVHKTSIAEHHHLPHIT
jgi:hypothetical protein